MKANEAPKKIYYAPYGDMRVNHPITVNDIEYIRKDAFIEKAVKWLEDNAINYWGTDAVDNGKMMLDFKIAMKL